MKVSALCGLALATLCLLAGVTAAAEGAPTLEQRLAHFVRGRVGDPSARIEVPLVPVDAQERSLDVSFSIHPRQKLSGRVPVRVALADAGQAIRSIVVPVDVVATRHIVVAARPIRAGETIARDALALEERGGTQLPRDAVTDPAAVIGLRARTHLAAGSAVRASRLEAATDVRRGQTVRLVLRTGGLVIESMGRAQQDGNQGDWIAVENVGSRRKVTARVGSDGALHVVP